MAVSSYYVEPAGVLIDPMLPEAGLGAFEGRSRPRQVVLSSGNHIRDTRSFVEAFGCTVVVSREGAERIGGKLEAEIYSDSEDIAPA